MNDVTQKLSWCLKSSIAASLYVKFEYKPQVVFWHIFISILSSMGHFGALPGPKTNYMINFNNISIASVTLHLRMSFDEAQ